MKRPRARACTFGSPPVPPRYQGVLAPSLRRNPRVSLHVPTAATTRRRLRERAPRRPAWRPGASDITRTGLSPALTAKLETCQHTALQRMPLRTGRDATLLRVGLVVRPNGTIAYAGVLAQHNATQSLSCCVVNALRGAKLPRAAQAGYVAQDLIFQPPF